MGPQLSFCCLGPLPCLWADGSGELPDGKALCTSFLEMEATCFCPHGHSNLMANIPVQVIYTPRAVGLWVSACKRLEVSSRGARFEWRSNEGLARQESVPTEASVRSREGCMGKALELKEV